MLQVMIFCDVQIFIVLLTVIMSFVGKVRFLFSSGIGLRLSTTCSYVSVGCAMLIGILRGFNAV